MLTMGRLNNYYRERMSLYHIAERILREEGKTTEANCYAKKLHDLKLQYRYEYRDEERENANSPCVILNSGYTSDYTSFVKSIFPGTHFTEEEKREYINEEWMHINSPYDCTGRWFTIDIKIFDRPEGTLVYHIKGLDI